MALTAQECKSKLFKLGMKYGVSPALISTKLLSEQDKKDMVDGLLPDDSFDCHVSAWKGGGCRSFSKGL